MRLHLFSFLCLSSLLGALAAVGAEEDLRCQDEIGESAQSLLSSAVNVLLKYRKPSSKTAQHSNVSLASLSTHAGLHSQPDLHSPQNFKEDYLLDGEAVQAIASNAMPVDHIMNQEAIMAAPRPVDFHSNGPPKADTTVAAVIAAAAAEATAGSKPPATGLSEVAKAKAPTEDHAAETQKVTNVEEPAPHKAEPSEADLINAENIEVVTLLSKFHMSFWMDVLLLLLFLTCCCCCLREFIASYREKRIDDEHAGEKQIVHYDADRLVHLSILLRLFAKGSLCAKGKVWQQVTFFFILWVVLTLVLLSTIRYASKLDDKSIRTLSSYLNSFMPFFFAMYLNVVFGRWWTMRTAGLGAMWQVVDDLCVILASHCPGDKFEQQRSTLLRYGLLSQALIYQVARKQVYLEQLVTDGLLMPSEKLLLEEAPGSLPQTVWVWILDLWRKLHTEGHIEWWVVQHAQKLCGEGRRAIKTIFTYVTCQIPFGWVHLMTFMVNITLIVLVTKAAIITAKDVAHMQGSVLPCTMDIREGFSCNSDFHDQVSIFSQIIQLIIVPFLFLAFLEFTNELTNPFGEDPHDFPRKVYMCGMRDENLGFFHVAGKGTLQGGPRPLML